MSLSVSHSVNTPLLYKKRSTTSVYLSEIRLLISGEGDAACGLGGVYQQMGEYEKALQYHQLDLQLAEMTSNPVCQCKYLLTILDSVPQFSHS